MSGVDVWALAANITKSMFRLEARERYNVAYEAELIRAFEQGRPQPENESVMRHMTLMRSLRTAGKRPYRVHVISQPLASYLRYELDAYQENVEAGEEILIADRAWHAELDCLTDDFLLLDGDTDHASVIWYRYGENDDLSALEYSADPADIASCRQHRDLAMKCAVPVDEFNRSANLT